MSQRDALLAQAEALETQAATLRALAEGPTAAPPLPGPLVHVRESRLGYRRALQAIKSGELRGFRVGHGTWIETAAEDAYIMAHPVQREALTAEPDEIGDLIVANDRRRRPRGQGLRAVGGRSS